MTVVAVFGQPLVQRFHLPGQLFDLLPPQAVLLFQQSIVLLLVINQFPLQVNLLSQQSLLFSQVDQSFFGCHVFTLHGTCAFDKSLGYLSSYNDKSNDNNDILAS